MPFAILWVLLTGLCHGWRSVFALLAAIALLFCEHSVVRKARHGWLCLQNTSLAQMLKLLSCHHSSAPEKFVHIAQTGDVLLFRSEGTAPMIIRAASGGHFDHVALILKLHDGTLALLEATGNLGVGVCTWTEFVENSWQNLYPEIAIRRVRFQRTAERLSALEAWCFAVNGKPYSLTISKLRQRESVSSGAVSESNSFFCSELVAEALKVLGVLPRGLSSSQWWPSSFETSQQLPVETCPHASFGEQLTIDFSLNHQPSIQEEKSCGPAKQRDATTNW